MCIIKSFTTIDPELVWWTTWSILLLLGENMYKDKGFSLFLMKEITSSKVLTSMIGKIGPKISSCMRTSVSLTPVITVGWM